MTAALTPDRAALRDLTLFARLETTGGDLEPWAAVIGWLHRAGHLDVEQVGWLLTLYNTYDDIGSAWRVMQEWPDPRYPAPPAARALAPNLPIGHERRNLLGGRVLRRFDSYTSHLDGRTQQQWLCRGLPCADPDANFLPLHRHLRRVWGVGRQSAFEWAEFWAKVTGAPVEAPHAHLWESSGPRQSLEHLYGPPPGGRVTVPWLDTIAAHCRAALAAAGVHLSWWDFETVICDFRVMRHGRYYPGQHIAMIRQEIEGLSGGDRDLLRAALTAAVPAGWRDIPPGVDKALRARYRDTGQVTPPACVTTQGAP